MDISTRSSFVGRIGELDVLDRALRETSAGEPQAVFIGGEAGVGKTRLVEEFLRAAEEAGAVCAVGGCLEVGAQELPYASVVAVLHRLRRTLGVEFEQTAQGYQDQLGGLLPDPDGAGPAPGGQHGRVRLFEQVVTLMERLAQERTLVLAIEDLHWSDRSTRELLAFLIRNLHRSRVLLLVTHRTDGLPRRHPLRPYLAELERLRPVRRLALARFARPEVEQQIVGLLHTPAPDQGLVDRIYERSEGNAFFVEELVLSYRNVGSATLSTSLRDILLARVDALPDSALVVVAVAAGGGTRVEHGLLSAVVDLPDDDLFDALRAAVEAHVLVPEEEGEAYRFRHALTQEAVMDDLLPGERSRINRRYATALENDPGLVPAEQRAGRLAGYWYHAHHQARALPAALDASRQARRSNAYAEQALMLERVLEMWEHATEEVLRDLPSYAVADESYPPRPDAHGADPGAGRLRLVDVLADAALAAHRSGDHDLSARFARTACDLVDGATEPERAAWFWLQRARSAIYRVLPAEEELEQARLLVEARPPSAVQADVLSHVMISRIYRRRPSSEQLAVSESAHRIARDVGATRVEAFSLLVVGVLRTLLGEVEEGLSLVRETLLRAVKIGDPFLQATACIHLAALSQRLGRSREAVEVAREGRELAHRYGLGGMYEVLMLRNLVTGLLALGRLDEAEELLASQKQTDGTVGDFVVMRLRAEASLLHGDPAGAARGMAPLSHDALRQRYPEESFPAADLLVRVATQEGRFADARAALFAVLDDVVPAGTEHVAWPLLVHAAAAEADSRGLPGTETGRPEAVSLICRSAPQLSRTVPVYEGWAQMLDAELARAEGRDTPAQWLRAVETLRRAGLPAPLARALYMAAGSLAATGSRREAAPFLQEAERQARTAGDAGLLREVTALATRTGLPLDDSAPAGSARTGSPEALEPSAALGLTARERDVLRLLMLGHTNRHIAEELYISPNTAGVHVSNILTKLQVGNRGEAVAAAHRMRLIPRRSPDQPA